MPTMRSAHVTTLPPPCLWRSGVAGPSAGSTHTKTKPTFNEGHGCPCSKRGHDHPDRHQCPIVHPLPYLYRKPPQTRQGNEGQSKAKPESHGANGEATQGYSDSAADWDRCRERGNEGTHLLQGPLRAAASVWVGAPTDPRLRLSAPTLTGPRSRLAVPPPGPSKRSRPAPAPTPPASAAAPSRSPGGPSPPLPGATPSTPPAQTLQGWAADQSRPRRSAPWRRGASTGASPAIAR